MGPFNEQTLSNGRDGTLYVLNELAGTGMSPTAIRGAIFGKNQRYYQIYDISATCKMLY